MKPENLDTATKLVKQLNEVQEKLTAVEQEKNNGVENDWVSTGLSVCVLNRYLYLQDDKASAWQILDILIEKYTKQKNDLLTQIHAL